MFSRNVAQFSSQSSSQLTMTHHILIIDSQVDDYQQLVAGAKPGFDVFVLDAHHDGIEQITQILNSLYLTPHASLSLHIVSHGSPGCIYLGNSQLSLHTLERYAEQIQSWFPSQASELLLYGCNVAAGDAGTEFIDTLCHLTHANIFASRHVIGQGDWVLEVSSASSKTSAPFELATLATWRGQLAPTINNLDDSSYTEQEPAFVIDNDVSFSGGANYAGGFLEFSLDNAASSDQLTLLTDGSASTINGEISIVGSTVYLGNGTSAEIVGFVDSSFNGRNGNALRINFTAGFPNGSFDLGVAGDTTITDWTTVNQQVKFGTDTIAGLPTPTDTTIPPNAPNSDQNTPAYPGTFTTVLSSIQNDGSGNSVQLTSTGITTAQGYDVVRGPYIYSNATVSLQAGDQISFEWQAQGGDDAYDVYGYLVDVNTGNIITVLDETGGSTSSTTWATETLTVSQAGEYKFVFVAGTYDLTGGTVAGAQLFIDDVRVIQANPPFTLSDLDVSDIAQRVQYNNTSDSPSATKNLTVSVQNNAAETTSATATINITVVDDEATIGGGSLGDDILTWDSTNTLSATNGTYQFGLEINGKFLYVTDYSGSNIDIYSIDPATGSITYNSTYGSQGTGVDQFLNPLDLSFKTTSAGQTKAYVMDYGNRRIVVLDVNTNTGALTWDTTNTLTDTTNISGAYGLEVNGDFLYVTDANAGNIDIYAIDPTTGALTYNSTYGSPGSGVAQFSSIIDIDFLTTPSGQTKAYVADSSNGRIVVLDVDPATGALTWDSTNTLSDTNGTTQYGLEVNGNFLYVTDYVGGNIDIYSIDPATGSLTYNSTYGSQGADVDQFGSYSIIDIDFLTTSSGQTKAYVADSLNQRIVVLDVAPETDGTSGTGDEDSDAITGTLIASDPDGLTDGTYFSIESGNGATNGSASIDPETGEWSYTPNANFSGTDSFTVTITDDQGGTTTQIINITVNNVDDPTTVGGNTSGTGDEDGGAIAGTLTASDPDGLTDGTYFSIESGDGATNGSASIDPETGEWSYTPNANFSGADSFTVTITDDQGGTTTQIINITVNNVDDPTTVGGNTSGTGDEDGGAIAGTLTASDLEGLTDGTYFSIESGDGATNGSASIDPETGEWSYTPNANFSGTDSFTVTITDDQAGTTTQVITITVNNVDDDLPTVGGDTSGSGNEDGSAITGTLTASDPDGLTDGTYFSIESGNGATNGSTSIDPETGEWSYTPNANFNGNDSFAVTITDDQGGTTTQIINITVNSVDDGAPSFTSAPDPSVEENTTAVTTVTAVDPDGGAVTYAITGGVDQSRFTINTTTGVLSFINAPDAENPLDADGDNVYQVEVTATDGNEGTAVQALTVAVGNINDNVPVFTSSATPTMAENSTVATTVVATDADGDSITYAIAGGVDAALFEIDETTGELSFITAPNFEMPTDNNGVNSDNVYEVTVSANDGNGETTQDISVSVVDLSNGVTDFNNDNLPDVVWRRPSTGQTNIWFTDGKIKIGGGPAGATIENPNWLTVGVGDFDKDGKRDDILWRNVSSGANVIWFMDGINRVGNATLDSIGTNWEVQGVGDFEHQDYTDDILWRNQSTGQTVVWTMNGASKTGTINFGTLGTAWKAQGVGDFEANNFVDDIVWRNYATGQTLVWTTDGQEKTGSFALDTVGVNWKIDGVGDLDGDGTVDDLLWYNTSNNSVSTWFIDNGAKYATSTVGAPSDGWDAVL